MTKQPNKKQPTRMYSFRIHEDTLLSAKNYAVKKRIPVSQIINQALILFLHGK